MLSLLSALSAQHAAQHADTVFVAVPRAVDSLSVHVTDTLHAIVRQTESHWYVSASLALALASFAVTAVLVWVTYQASRRMEGLQRANTDVQRDHADLQRRFNEMQAHYEQERRDAEGQRAKDHRQTVDARSSGIAYALRRQIEAWLKELPAGFDRLLEAVDWLGDPNREKYDPGATDEMGQWAQKRSGKDFDRAEERLLQLIASAPEASPAVADSIRRAYVMFYRATGRLNRQTALRLEDRPVDGQEYALAVVDLQECTSALTPAIGPELRWFDEGPGVQG